jgi:hypothetical protein
MNWLAVTEIRGQMWQGGTTAEFCHRRLRALLECTWNGGALDITVQRLQQQMKGVEATSVGVEDDEWHDGGSGEWYKVCERSR